MPASRWSGRRTPSLRIPQDGYANAVRFLAGEDDSFPWQLN